MVKKCFLTIIILLLIILFACNDKDNLAEQDIDKQQIAVESAEPTNEASENTYEPFSIIEMEDGIGWMNAGPGTNSGDTYDEAHIQSEIKNWPKDREPEEYFHRILAYTTEDFRVHQEYLDSIVVEFDNPSSRPEVDLDTDTFAASQNPAQNKLNIQILLDASGSMASQVDGGVKMNLAKEAIAEFASVLPEDAQVSLRVYGHKGTNELDGKELSCAATEEVYPLGGYDKEKFTDALDQFGPTGYTPLALAIEAAGEDLSKVHEIGTQSVVYVVSDGIETCNGDPVKAAKGLQSSDIEAIVNIIGFDIQESERATLEAIADAGAGEYFQADTEDELKETLRKQKQELLNAWQEWINENVDKNIEEVNNYLTPAYDHEEDALEKSNREEERQLELISYMEGVSDKFDTVKIRELIQNRALNMRQYIRKEFVYIRQEARKKGLELRENVREEGYEERQNISDEDNNDKNSK